MTLWLNIFSFLGLFLLSFPTLRANKLKRLQSDAVQHANANQDLQDTDLIKIVAKALVDKRDQASATWRMRDQACLFAGYLLLLGSSFLRIFDKGV